MERREFLRQGLCDYIIDLAKSFNFSTALEEQKTTNENDYFKSFYSCYPLLSEAPYDQLVETAEKLGISVKNKTKLEIAKEVFGERR